VAGCDSWQERRRRNNATAKQLLLHYVLVLRFGPVIRVNIISIDASSYAANRHTNAVQLLQMDEICELFRAERCTK
jgi:hypothetical protein